MTGQLKLGVLAAATKAIALCLGWEFVSRSSAWINHTFVDLWGWLDFMKKSANGLVPYVDFSKEYPVGAGVLYWVLGRLNPGGDPTHFLQLHAVVMSIWDVANAMLLFSILRELKVSRPYFFTWLFLLLPTAVILSPVRFEAVVLTFVLQGYRMHLRQRFHLATFWWSIGALIKVFPLLFIAIQELEIFQATPGKWRRIPKHGLCAGLIALGVFGVVNGPFLVAGFLRNGNADAWLHTFLFHVNRPLYWDTILGVMHLWRGAFEWERYASAWSSALMLVFLFWPVRLRIEARSVLMMCAALVFNRVYSTQFHLWFYPMLVVLLATAGNGVSFRRLFCALVLIDVVNVLVYPFAFSECLQEIHTFGNGAALVSGGGWTVFFSALILLRALILIGVMVLMIKEKPPIERLR